MKPNYQSVEGYGATIISPIDNVLDENTRLRSSSYDKKFEDFKGVGRTRSSSFYMGEKKLGLAALVVLTFYSVSGGPFGIEDIVRAGNNIIIYINK